MLSKKLKYVSRKDRNELRKKREVFVVIIFVLAIFAFILTSFA